MFPPKPNSPSPMMGTAPQSGAHVEPSPGGGFNACFPFPSAGAAQQFINQQKQDGDYPPSGRSEEQGEPAPRGGASPATSSLGALARATGRPLGV